MQQRPGFDGQIGSAAELSYVAKELVEVELKLGVDTQELQNSCFGPQMISSQLIHYLEPMLMKAS